MPAHLPEVRPLLVTRHDGLLDEVLRIAALAGTDVHVEPDPVAARPPWTTAPLVLVGADVVVDHTAARLPRRRDVTVVVTADSDPDGRFLTDGQLSQAGWDLAAEFGADQVLTLPQAESWLVRRFTESTAGPRTAKVVAVVPGSGGAGASVLAAGLAVTAVRSGLRPMLIDADPLGGGLDVLLGLEERTGLRWPDLSEASGAMSVDGLYSALPRLQDLVLLSWDRSHLGQVPPAAVDAVIDAGRRGSDLVVVDLPRVLDETSVRVLQAADLALLVARPEVRACAAAARVAAVLRLHCPSLELVVRGPAPGNLRPEDVRQALELPLAGTLRPEPGLPVAVDRGEPPAATGRGALATLCRGLLSRLDVRSEDAA